jgi:hypothetical protein
MITREQIKKTLDEIYDAEYGDGDGESTLADGITFWLQNGEYPFDVIETIIDAVHELSGRPRNALGWYAEPLRDEFSYTGEVAFVLVDAESGCCLTMHRPDCPSGYTSISVALPVTTEEEAVDAVAYFLRLLGVAVEERPLQEVMCDDHAQTDQASAG